VLTHALRREQLSMISLCNKVRDRKDAITSKRDARATLALARPLSGRGAWA